MRISREEVDYLCELARLTLSEQEAEALTSDLDEILNFAESIQSVDTTGVAPMSHVLSLQNVWRADRLRPSLPVASVLQNAPESVEQMFAVPGLLEEE
ncbi:MAG: Asp-tRNA(Asn)/Glu-tRNA(Gln) amidotransferase subunit GatC [Firmicutes bacterium]|nr:Asp-tRNA(Asn)/Glu-tRNA(Gln) amidotransferase subunit GatC [Bacillota bacterium]